MSKKLSGKRPLLDTNVFIERSITEAILFKMALSSVVLYELIAANIGDDKLNVYLSWAKIYRVKKRLITPTAADWLECSKLIRNMVRGSRSKTAGYVKKIASAQQQQNDALIARSAVLNDCFVVTNNVRDFEKFKPYMSGFTVVPADDYFAP